MTDARVELIRKDPRVGRGSCSTIDECYDDSEIEEILDHEQITLEMAVGWAHAREGIVLEQALNTRWGSDEDPEVAAYNRFFDQRHEERCK